MRFRCPACHRQYRLAPRRSSPLPASRPTCRWCRVELRLARVIGLPSHEQVEDPDGWHGEVRELPSDPAARARRSEYRRVFVGAVLGGIALTLGLLGHTERHLPASPPPSVATELPRDSEPAPFPWPHLPSISLDLAAAVQPPVLATVLPVLAPTVRMHARRKGRRDKAWPVAGPSSPLLPSLAPPDAQTPTQG